MKTLIQYLQDSITANWEQLALTDFNGPSYQYRDIARKVAKLHLAFESAGIKKDDKIAICGKNSAQWAVAFIATVTYGAVAVPILHEFKADNIHHLVTHSEARLLFTDDTIWENLNPASMEKLEGVLKLGDFSLIMSRNKRLTAARNSLNEMFGKRYPERFTPGDVVYAPRKMSDLAVINYTSGSTGFSKGVMLTVGNLTSNLKFAVENLDFFKPGDPLVCMLPLAHMYGLLVELLHPLAKGCHIYFLTRVPSPRVILEAFATVRPKLIVTVPLIIEKIVKTKVFPLLEKPLMKVLMHVPFVDDKLLDKIKKSLLDAFGGNVEEIIIGGAGLNKDVEAFLRRIQFPYTVGYGMTECAPLIAYAHWQDARAQSCGRVVDRMECRIDSPDPENTPGELWVKGDNVMAGYYKNRQATDSVIKNGWMNRRLMHNGLRRVHIHSRTKQKHDSGAFGTKYISRRNRTENKQPSPGIGIACSRRPRGASSNDIPRSGISCKRRHKRTSDREPDERKRERTQQRASCLLADKKGKDFISGI